MAGKETLPFYAFSSIPTDFLAFQQEVASKEGFHYYLPPGQHCYMPAFKTPYPGVVGFTVRIFCFKDREYCAPVITFSWRDYVLALYETAVGIEDNYMTMKYQKHTGKPTEKSNIKVETGTYFSIALRVKDTQHLSVFYNRREFNFAWMKETVDTTWNVGVSAYCPTMSAHITRETEPFPSGYWSKKFYVEHITLPIGTIGVYTAKLVDNTAKNVIYLKPDYSEQEYALEFSHGSLPNGTLLQYTVRITNTESIVTASFDRTVHRVGKSTTKVVFFVSHYYPTRINASFSSAVHPLTLECQVPYHNPPTS